MNKINILLLVFSVTLIAIYFLIDERKASINLEEKLDKKIIVNGLDLEEYIIGVVAAEMPASFEEEALKSQAVAARSYAIYKINKGDRLTNNTNEDGKKTAPALYANFPITNVRTDIEQNENAKNKQTEENSKELEKEFKEVVNVEEMVK